MSTKLDSVDEGLKQVLKKRYFITQLTQQVLSLGFYKLCYQKLKDIYKCF